MQRLETPAHDLGKAGVARDLAHRHAIGGQQLRGAARREDLDVAPGELARQLDEAGLVGNREECAAYRRGGMRSGHALTPPTSPSKHSASSWPITDGRCST